MDRKKWFVIFFIAFMGMWGIIAVDQECKTCTGAGGKTGLTLNKTVEGDLSFCFFGLEGEINL